MAQPTLSFPRPIFAAVSPSPFLQAHLTPSPGNKGIRANGRTPQEFRPPSANTGSLTHCNGSAVVRVGNTAVVCGVRAEILRAEDIAQPVPPPSNPHEESHDSNNDDDDNGEDAEITELDTLRLLVPNIELSTGSAPTHLPGSAPTSLAQTLVSRIRSQLLSTRLVRASDLRILYTSSTASPPLSLSAEVLETPDAEEAEPEIKAYWTLYIDTLFISLDGNAFDAAWSAILAALRNTVLPKAWYDEEFETVLCSDAVSEARKLRLRGMPMATTFAVFEGRSGGQEDEEGGKESAWVLCDPDAFEEGLCKEVVTVTVDCEGKGRGEGEVRRIEKSGGGVVGRDIMRGLVKKSVERWKVWDKVLKGEQ